MAGEDRPKEFGLIFLSSSRFLHILLLPAILEVKTENCPYHAGHNGTDRR